MTIYCPVHYCKERPFIRWCKIEAHECVPLDNSKAEWNSTVFILKFFAIHQNDSGMYRCQAVTANFFSESNEIKVIVEGEAPALLKSPFKQMDSMYRKVHSCCTMASLNKFVWCRRNSTRSVVLVLTTFFMLLSCFSVLGKEQIKK